MWNIMIIQHHNIIHLLKMIWEVNKFNNKEYRLKVQRECKIEEDLNLHFRILNWWIDLVLRPLIEINKTILSNQIVIVHHFKLFLLLIEEVTNTRINLILQEKGEDHKMLKKLILEILVKINKKWCNNNWFLKN